MHTSQVVAGTKHCPECSVRKPRGEFNRNRSKYDGLQSLCRDCDNTRRRAGRLAMTEEQRERERQRERDRVRDPEKTGAKYRTWKAVLHGALLRAPCESCGAPKAEAHHDDYSRPLDVRWLCRSCHMRHHANEQAQREAS
jgi:hypothetical protein